MLNTTEEIAPAAKKIIHTRAKMTHTAIGKKETSEKDYSKLDNLVKIEYSKMAGNEK